MAVVIPASCGGGDDEDEPTKPTPVNPQPQPQPDPEPSAADPITGLSSLDGILQVDVEVNLLGGLTFAQGVELTKTEIEFEGQRTEIADPQHFTPEYPGSCTLFFSVKKNGTIGEVKAENLTIKPLENYTEVIIVTADMIAKFYPWYNNLQQSTKDFIYPHLLSSYAACNWSKLDNRVHIIMGETPAADDVENV